jgi:hypothetical protein
MFEGRLAENTSFKGFEATLYLFIYLSVYLPVFPSYEPSLKFGIGMSWKL